MGWTSWLTEGEMIICLPLSSKIVEHVHYGYSRPGRPMNISFVVGHAKNFPVDLYFLMDLSWSMRSSRD